jgi:hypothetical protein
VGDLLIDIAASSTLKMYTSSRHIHHATNKVPGNAPSGHKDPWVKTLTRSGLSAKAIAPNGNGPIMTGIVRDLTSGTL